MESEPKGLKSQKLDKNKTVGSLINQSNKGLLVA